ncbi:hypothetical protein OAV30_00040 [Candidatus Pelagibacter sp.]|nr:hypothetical protein [Candidatus Pelagibacter sp.]
MIKSKKIILSFSILLFCYVFFKSEIFWDGELRHYYKKYFYFSYLAIFCSIIFFFIKDEILKYIYIIFISCLIGLYIFEVYLTFFTIYRGSVKIDSQNIKIYKNETGLEYDTRQKFEIYDDLKKINSNTKVLLGPRNHKNNNLYSLSGISNVNTILCNENGYYAIYKSDRYGFRNDDENWNKLNLEYVVVGDSYGIGECVKSDKTIMSFLEKFSKKTALSLAFGGNGPLTEYATLREYLKPNMNKIIWIYFEGNDQSNLNRELKSEILTNYLKDKNFTQDLISKQNQINKLLEEKIEIEREKLQYKFERSFFYNLVKFLKLFKTRDTLQSLYLKNNSQKIEIKNEFFEIMKLTKELVNNNNSELYFVYLPDVNVIKARCYNKNESYDLIKRFIKIDLNINFIDLCEKLFHKIDDPLKLFPFRKKGHFNEFGYETISKIIYENTK